VALITGTRGTLTWARSGFGPRVPAAVAGSLCTQQTASRGLCEAAVSGLNRTERYYLWVASGCGPGRGGCGAAARARRAAPGSRLGTRVCQPPSKCERRSARRARVCCPPLPPQTAPALPQAGRRAAARWPRLPGGARRLQHPKAPPDDTDVPLRFAARADGRCNGVVFPRQPRAATLGAGDAGGAPAAAPSAAGFPTSQNPGARRNPGASLPISGTGQPAAGPLRPADGAVPGGAQPAGLAAQTQLPDAAALGASGSLQAAGGLDPGCVAPLPARPSCPCLHACRTHAALVRVLDGPRGARA
jgi:hypothetical protein